MSGVSITLNIVNKSKNNLKFLHHKNSFLAPALRCLLCNVLIQSQFDHACSAWYHNLFKKLKDIQTIQNIYLIKEEMCSTINSY